MDRTEHIKSLWDLVDAMDWFLSTDEGIIPTVNELNEPELLAIHKEFEAGLEVALAGTRKMQDWCKRQIG